MSFGFRHSILEFDFDESLPLLQIFHDLVFIKICFEMLHRNVRNFQCFSLHWSFFKSSAKNGFLRDLSLTFFCIRKKSPNKRNLSYK